MQTCWKQIWWFSAMFRVSNMGSGPPWPKPPKLRNSQKNHGWKGWFPMIDWIKWVHLMRVNAWFLDAHVSGATVMIFGDVLRVQHRFWTPLAENPQTRKNRKKGAILYWEWLSAGVADLPGYPRSDPTYQRCRWWDSAPDLYDWRYSERAGCFARFYTTCAGSFWSLGLP